MLNQISFKIHHLAPVFVWGLRLDSVRNVLLGLISRQKLKKRMERSFLRTEKNGAYQTEKNGVPNPDINPRRRKLTAQKYTTNFLFLLKNSPSVHSDQTDKGGTKIAWKVLKSGPNLCYKELTTKFTWLQFLAKFAKETFSISEMFISYKKHFCFI